MKLFKIIAVCIVSVVLVVSLVLNVFLLCGFEISRKNDEAEPPTVSEIVETSEPGKPDKAKSPTVYVSKPESNVQPSDGKGGTLVYWDDNIKVIYTQSSEKECGIIHRFKIQNASSKTLSVLFTDVCINGRQVYISGLTCEHLLSGIETIGELVLMKKDWEQFTDSPSKVSFVIKLVNDKSQLDLYETERITLDF